MTLLELILSEIPESQIMERVTGIEPVSRPWEGHVLPLNHTRTSYLQTIKILALLK